MKVYIAGPIAGKPEQNRAAFSMTAGVLLGLGHEPVNPHSVDHTHTGECTGDEVPRQVGGSVGTDEVRIAITEPDPEHKYGCYMKADIRALLECEAAVFLPGWKDSRGAYVERKVAEICGLKIMEFWEIMELDR